MNDPAWKAVYEFYRYCCGYPDAKARKVADHHIQLKEWIQKSTRRKA